MTIVNNLRDSNSIELVNLKIPWGLWFYRCIFPRDVNVSRFITIKSLAPTLSLNSNRYVFTRGKTTGLRDAKISWISSCAGSIPVSDGEVKIRFVQFVSRFSSSILMRSRMFQPWPPVVPVVSGSGGSKSTSRRWITEHLGLPKIGEVLKICGTIMAI